MKTANPQSLKQPVLIVEDAPSQQLLYRTVLRRAGFPVICVENGKLALEAFRTHWPKLVLVDLNLPDTDGVSLMREILMLQPATRVIVITADGTVPNAVDATRNGAHDFLVKPLGDLRLVGAVSKAMADLRSAEQVLPPNNAPESDPVEPVFLGQSPAMREVMDKISAIARSMAPVFIIGESGSGKTSCARAIHRQSARAQGPFVSVNCAAIAPDLLEEELFGPQFDENQPPREAEGAIARADGGMLFLKNPQDMRPELQARFLRFLQRGALNWHKDSKPKRVDVRVVCAASRDPVEAMRDGRFVEDLYYRLLVLPMTLPPLRDRDTDIELLALEYIRRIGAEEGKLFDRISPAALSVLSDYRWPGNLREMINALRHAIVLHDGPEVGVNMLPSELQMEASEGACALGAAASLEGRTMAQIEEIVIKAAVARHSGSVPRAARELDIAPSTIYRKREIWEKGQL